MDQSLRKNLVDDIIPIPVKERSSLGKVSIYIDEKTELTAVGVIYGIQSSLNDKNYAADLFLDHYNQRLKILHYSGDIGALILRVRAIAEINGFDKIICFAKRRDWQKFLSHGYVLEAILKYHNKGEDAYIVSKFRSQERLSSSNLMEEMLLIENIMNLPVTKSTRTLPNDFFIRDAKEEDIPALINLYKSIFATYPSPLIYEDYLKTVFGKDSLFSVIEHNGTIVAAASAELDYEYLAAELTDCATHPSVRGLGLMSIILQRLETIIREKGFICSYTMARARSYGMNSVFYHLDYEFLGRLVNNCDIFGAYEDMNIWVKDLRGP